MNAERAAALSKAGTLVFRVNELSKVRNLHLGWPVGDLASFLLSQLSTLFAPRDSAP